MLVGKAQKLITSHSIFKELLSDDKNNYGNTKMQMLR